MGDHYVYVTYKFIIFRIVFSDRPFLINIFFFRYFRKLSAYSPNDTSKAFDRAVTRRTNVKFDPKQTIEILKLGEPSSELNDEQKLDLVKKYMDVSIISNNFKKIWCETVSRHYQLTTISRDFSYMFDTSSIGYMNIILSRPPLIVDVKPILTQKSTFYSQNW